MENKKEEVIEKTIVTETESPQPSSSAETTKESAAASEDRQQRVVARNSIEAELMSESRGRFHALSYVGQTPLSLSYSVVHISPITILLSVNVSTEATVWCGAWPLGEEMNLKLLQASTPGVVVSGRCLFCHSSFGTHHITSSLITHHSSFITSHSSLITSHHIITHHITHHCFHIITHHIITHHITHTLRLPLLPHLLPHPLHHLRRHLLRLRGHHLHDREPLLPSPEYHDQGEGVCH